MEQNEAIDIPQQQEEAPQPEPGPITAENVVTPDAQDAAPSAPDSSILSKRIEEMLARRDPPPKPEVSPQEQQIQQLIDALRQDSPQTRQKQQQNDDMIAQLQEKLDSVQKSHDQLRDELMQKQQQQEEMRAAEEVAQWVGSNDEHYPLVNKAGMQQWVFAKMQNTKQATGRMPSVTHAAKEMNDEIAKIVNDCAPLLGWMRKEEVGQSEEPVSPNMTGLHVSSPVERDKMSEDEWFEHQLRQINKMR